MSASRDALIQETTGFDFPYAEEGRVFLEQEERAVIHIEYSPDAIPTFAQIPELSRRYMRTYGDYASDKISLGIRVRAMRAREAVSRTNILYMTEQALDMSTIITDDGEQVTFETPEDVRDRQLRFLSTVALQPHIDLRLVPRDIIPSDLGTTILFGFKDATQSIFTERDGGITGPITDPQEMEPYLVGLDYLDGAAMSHEETQVFLADSLRR